MNEPPVVHTGEHWRNDHRGGGYHRGNDRMRGHHHDNHYVHTPQSSDIGYGSGVTETPFSSNPSEHSSFISTPQTPHTPHTPQTPHMGFPENQYGQYGMQQQPPQNMGYNMNAPHNLNQNLPPQHHMGHNLPPPAVNMNQGYGGQYQMPHHQQPYDQGPHIPPPQTQQHNQYHNSNHGNQSFHRKDRDRDRDRDRYRDRDRDRDRDRERNDWRRDRDRRDRDRDRGVDIRGERDDRMRRRDRGDRGDRRNNNDHFRSPPPPRAPSPEPERQPAMSLESRIASLLRQNRAEEPPAFGSGDEGSHSSHSSSSHSRKEEYHEPHPPCPASADVAPPPLPLETPPPLPPMENLPPLPTREELPPLPPLPPDLEAEAAALSLPSDHLSNSQPHHPAPLPPHPHTTPTVCDNSRLDSSHRPQDHTQTDSKPDHSESNSDQAAANNDPSSTPSQPPLSSDVQNSGSTPAADQTPLNDGGGDAMEESEKEDDDDRMSLSSISSGENTLEVNVPKPPEQVASSYMDMTQPPPMYWAGSQQQNFPNNFDGSFSSSYGGQNNLYGQSFNGSPAKPALTLTPEDESREKAFVGVLQQVESACCFKTKEGIHVFYEVGLHLI